MTAGQWGVIGVAFLLWLAGLGTLLVADRLRTPQLVRQVREQEDSIDAYEGRLVATENRVRALDGVVDQQCVLLADGKAREEVLRAALTAAGVDIPTAGEVDGVAEPGVAHMPEPSLLRLTTRETSILEAAVSSRDDFIIDNDRIRESFGCEPDEWNVIVDKVRALNG